MGKFFKVSPHASKVQAELRTSGFTLAKVFQTSRPSINTNPHETGTHKTYSGDNVKSLARMQETFFFSSRDKFYLMILTQQKRNA